MQHSFSDNEIKVMHYLFDNAVSSDADILKNISSISGRAALSSMILRFKKIGVILVKREVLYSLSEIGKVLIGKLKPNHYQKNEMKRCGFPEEIQTLDKTHSEAKAKNPVLGSLEKINVLNSVNSTVSESYVEHKKKKKPLARSVLALSNFEKNSPDWLFLSSEIEILHALNVDVDDFELGAIEKDSDAMRALVARALVLFENGEYSLSNKGKMLYSEKTVSPANTALFSLTRMERIIVEVMAFDKRYGANIGNQKAVFEKVFPGVSLDKMYESFDSLTTKRFIVKKTNHVRYLTPAATVSIGAVVFKEDGPLLDYSDLPIYEELVEAVRGSDFHVEDRNIPKRIRAKRPSKSVADAKAKADADAKAKADADAKANADADAKAKADADAKANADADAKAKADADAKAKADADAKAEVDADAKAKADAKAADDAVRFERALDEIESLTKSVEIVKSIDDAENKAKFLMKLLDALSLGDSASAHILKQMSDDYFSIAKIK